MAKGGGDSSERIIVPMSRELLSQIEDFRFDRRMPSRAEAIRKLIEAGLKAKTPRNAPKPRNKT